ncbi:MAG: poly-beta-1,6-N-acetyl-D-glucosamine synthase, partial [Bacteroidetes bacterium]|nr:poly-beta-1,6-N-acetyl-D-glucosamine synthase [Bacteroidota bacterium]
PKGVNGKKYGITQGIKTAQYEIILLTDADCYPVNNHWIQQMAKDFSDGTEIILGFSQYEKTSHLLNSFIRFETLYTGLQYISMALAGKPYMGVGRNLAYKRSFFLERKGFEKHLHITGGDDDLFVNHNANAQNSKVAIGSNSLIKSIPKSNYSDFFKQKKRHLSVGKYYKLNDKINLGLLSISHIFFWVTFVILVGFGKELLVIGFVLLFKAFLLYLVFIPSSIKLGDKIDGWNLLILDFLYPIYLIIIGFPALTAKSIKWS